ncbi:sialate O-acetylesterase [Bacteroides faecis]|nr:sialate O-acetylesterase [Bacteroides faecis]
MVSGRSQYSRSEAIQGAVSAMVSQWRDFFHNPEMPFYYVQIAPWKSEGNDKLDWAWFRQCQLELMKEVPNVGMVTTGDAGSETLSTHPIR